MINIFAILSCRPFLYMSMICRIDISSLQFSWVQVTLMVYLIFWKVCLIVNVFLKIYTLLIFKSLSFFMFLVETSECILDAYKVFRKIWQQKGRVLDFIEDFNLLSQFGFVLSIYASCYFTCIIFRPSYLNYLWFLV